MALLTAFTFVCTTGTSLAQAADEVGDMLKSESAYIQKAKDFDGFIALVTELTEKNKPEFSFPDITVEEGFTFFDMLKKAGCEEIFEKELRYLGRTIDGITDRLKEELTVTPSEMEKLGYEITEDEKGRLRITKPYNTARLIVHTKKDYSLKDDFGAQSVITDGEGRYVFQFASAYEAKNAQIKLEQKASVLSVSPDKVVRQSKVEVDSLIADYNLDRYGAERIESDRYISYLKKNNYTSKIVVATIDSGADTGHELLLGRLVDGYDYLEDDQYPLDDNGHGTHVAGIIADNTPETVKIMPIRCFDSSGESTDLLIALSIEGAIERKADVINMSFGGVCTDDECEVSLAVNKAEKAGVVCIAAAGNEYSDASVACPAKNKYCVTVSAVDEGDRLADFSNYGSAVDICAPGVDIWSSVPRTSGMYAQLSGTSMAAPFVSAAAAMILTKSPSLTPSKVRSQLKKATVDLGVKGKDQCFGNGVLDMGVYLGDRKSATSISTKTTSVTAYAGKYLKLPTKHIAATVKPFDATDKSYSVTFSDKSIASFDGFGVVGLKKGATTMKLTLPNKKSVSVKVDSKNSVFWIDYAASSYDSGKGTRKSPYIIKSASQLAKVSLDAYRGKLKDNTYFKLGKSFSLSGKNWYPIYATGVNGESLRIHLDGNGYTISNLTIGNYTLGVYTKGGGLFYCTRGEVKNLNLTNVNIDLPYSLYGGAVSACFGGYMKNCYASGKVKSGISGGLVGDLSLWGGTAYGVGISNCRSDVKVTGIEIAGGIVGYQLCGRINNCIFTGSTESDGSIGVTGGICAITGSGNAIEDTDVYAENTEIVNCVSVTNIAGIKLPYTSKGKTYKPTVSNCYYTGNYSDGIEDDYHEKSTSTKKTSTANIKLHSFYTKESNWDGDYPWSIGTLWIADSKALKLKTQKDKTKTLDYGYVDLGNEILVTSYNGTSSSITIPSKIDSKPVRYIDSDFLSVSKLKSITIPSSVTVIAPEAFSKDNLPYLTKVNLGSKVKIIAPAAFDRIDIAYLTVPESVTGISKGAFYNCAKLRQVFFLGKPAESWSRDAFIGTGENTDLTVYYPNNEILWTLFRFNGVKHVRQDMSKPAVILMSLSSEIKVGESKKISVTILPEGAKTSLKYYTSNKSVATVDSKGNVTGKKAGSVTITVKTSDGKLKVTKVITVVK